MIRSEFLLFPFHKGDTDGQRAPAAAVADSSNAVVIVKPAHSALAAIDADALGRHRRAVLVVVGPHAPIKEVLAGRIIHVKLGTGAGGGGGGGNTSLVDTSLQSNSSKSAAAHPHVVTMADLIAGRGNGGGSDGSADAVVSWGQSVAGLLQNSAVPITSLAQCVALLLARTHTAMRSADLAQLVHQASSARDTVTCAALCSLASSRIAVDSTTAAAFPPVRFDCVGTSEELAVSVKGGTGWADPDTPVDAVYILDGDGFIEKSALRLLALHKPTDRVAIIVGGAIAVRPSLAASAFVTPGILPDDVGATTESAAAGGRRAALGTPRTGLAAIDAAWSLTGSTLATWRRTARADGGVGGNPSLVFVVTSPVDRPADVSPSVQRHLTGWKTLLVNLALASSSSSQTTPRLFTAAVGFHAPPQARALYALAAEGRGQVLVAPAPTVAESCRALCQHSIGPVLEEARHTVLSSLLIFLQSTGPSNSNAPVFADVSNVYATFDLPQVKGRLCALGPLHIDHTALLYARRGEEAVAADETAAAAPPRSWSAIAFCWDVRGNHHLLRLTPRDLGAAPSGAVTPLDSARHWWAGLSSMRSTACYNIGSTPNPVGLWHEGRLGPVTQALSEDIHSALYAMIQRITAHKQKQHQPTPSTRVLSGVQSAFFAAVHMLTRLRSRNMSWCPQWDWGGLPSAASSANGMPMVLSPAKANLISGAPQQQQQQQPESLIYSYHSSSNNNTNHHQQQQQQQLSATGNGASPGRSVDPNANGVVGGGGGDTARSIGDVSSVAPLDSVRSATAAGGGVPPQHQQGKVIHAAAFSAHQRGALQRQQHHPQPHHQRPSNVPPLAIPGGTYQQPPPPLSDGDDGYNDETPLVTPPTAKSGGASEDRRGRPAADDDDNDDDGRPDDEIDVVRMGHQGGGRSPPAVSEDSFTGDADDRDQTSERYAPPHPGARPSKQQLEQGDHGFRATVAQVTQAQSTEYVGNAFVDTRWTSFGTGRTTASSLDALVTRSAPSASSSSGGNNHAVPSTVAPTAASYSIALERQHASNVYLKLVPPPAAGETNRRGGGNGRSGTKQLVSTESRKVFLFKITHACTTNPGKPTDRPTTTANQQVLELLSSAVLDADATEHAFSGIPRGVECVAVHLASRKDRVAGDDAASQWLSVEDLTVADGIQFTTPMWFANHPEVREVFPSSACIVWSGNAPSYIVTYQRLGDDGNHGGDDDDDDDDAGGNGDEPISVSASTPEVMLMGLEPATIYEVTISPATNAAAEGKHGSAAALGLEAVSVFVCTAVDFQPDQHLVSETLSLGALDSLGTLREIALLPPQPDVVNIDSAGTGAAALGGGGDVDANDRHVANLPTHVRLFLKAPVVVKRAGRLVAEIRPRLSANEIQLRDLHRNKPDGKTSVVCETAVAIGRRLSVGIDWSVTLRNDDDSDGANGGDEAPPIRTDHVASANNVEVGPFFSVLSGRAVNVGQDTAKLTWRTLDADVRVVLQKATSMSDPAPLGDEPTTPAATPRDPVAKLKHLSSSSEQCVIIRRGDQHLALRDLAPDTEYVATVIGQSSVNWARVNFRTLPAAPRASDFTFVLDDLKRKLRLSLPASRRRRPPSKTTVGTAAEEGTEEEEESYMVTVQPQDDVLVSDLDGPVTQSFDISPVSAIFLQLTTHVAVARAGTLPLVSPPTVLHVVQSIACDDRTVPGECLFSWVSRATKVRVAFGSAVAQVDPPAFAAPSLQDRRATSSTPLVSFPVPHQALLTPFSFYGSDLVPSATTRLYLSAPPALAASLFTVRLYEAEAVITYVGPRGLCPHADDIEAASRRESRAAIKTDADDTNNTSSAVIDDPLLTQRHAASTLHYQFLRYAVVFTSGVTSVTRDLASLVGADAAGDAGPDPVTIPLQLNRALDATVDVTLQVTFDNEAAASRDILCLNGSAAKKSHTSQIATPMVFDISGLAVEALASHFVTIKWQSLAREFVVALVDESGDVAQQCHTTTCRQHFDGLVGGRAYFVRVTSRQSGDHSGSIAIVTPAEAGGGRRSARNPAAMDGPATPIDGSALDATDAAPRPHRLLPPEMAEVSSVHAAFTIPPTERREIDSTMEGTPVKLLFAVHHVLRLNASPAVEWTSKDKLTPSSERQRGAPTSVAVPSPESDDQPSWCRFEVAVVHADAKGHVDRMIPLRHFSLFTRTECKVVVDSGNGSSRLRAPPPCDGVETRIDVVTSPQIDLLSSEWMSVSWLGSAERYDATVFLGVDSDTPIHRECKEMTRLSISAAKYAGELLRIRVSAHGTMSNTIEFCVVIPAEEPRLRIVGHNPSTLTCVIDPSVRSATGVLMRHEVVDPDGRRWTCPVDEDGNEAAVLADDEDRRCIEIELESTPDGSASKSTVLAYRRHMELTQAVAPYCVCLNATVTVERAVPVPALYRLQKLRLNDVTAASYDVSWVSAASEFTITTTTYQPCIADEEERMGDVSARSKGFSTPYRVAGSKRVVSGAHSFSQRGLVAGSITVISVQGSNCGDTVLTGAVMTRPAFVDRSMFMRRHADGTTVSFHFDDEPLFVDCGDWRIQLSRIIDVYSGEDVLESLKPNDPQSAPPRDDKKTAVTPTVKVALMADVTTFVYRRELQAVRRPASQCQAPPNSSTTLDTSNAGGGDAAVTSGDHNNSSVTRRRGDGSSASMLLTPPRARPGAMPDLLQAATSDHVVLCDVPSRCVIDRMALLSVTPQTAQLSWGCAPAVPTYQVQVGAVSSLARSERGHGTSAGPTLQMPSAPMASHHTGPKRCRVLSTSEPELDLDNLTPSTMYEVVVRVEAHTRIDVKCATEVMTLHDDAPQVAELRRFFITHPLRPIGHNYKRGVGTVTVVLDPARETASYGLSRFHAVRAIPENFVFMSDAPTSATQRTIPAPTLAGGGGGGQPTFVVTSDDLSYECGGTSDLHAATLQVKEPADSRTHRLEHYAVVTVDPDSACFSQCLNHAVWSEADIQPIQLLRSVTNPQIAYVSSNKAEVVWNASHENLRFDVSVRNLSSDAHDESIQRVIYSRIAYEGLKSGSLHGVTITPSHEGVPCRPHSFLFVTAPKRQKPPKIHFGPLNAIFDLPPTKHRHITTYPYVDNTTAGGGGGVDGTVATVDERGDHTTHNLGPFNVPPAAIQAKVEDGWSLTTTALVICTSDKPAASNCHSAQDFLQIAEQQNTFRSHPQAAQRVDIRLRCGKNYVFVFFWTARHPQALNGVVHSKPVVVEHRTDTYPPSHLHVITRSRGSVTLGWQSVDSSRETLRFDIECFSLPTGATTELGKLQGIGAVRRQVDDVDPSLATTSVAQIRGGDGGNDETASQASSRAAASGYPAAPPSTIGVSTSAAARSPRVDADRGRGKGAFTADAKVMAAMDSGAARLIEKQTVVTAASSPQFHCTFSNLEQELFYAFRVRSAHDGITPSPWSDIVVATTLRPPMPVTSVRVLGVTPNSINLAWSDVSNGALADSVNYIVNYRCFDGKINPPDQTAAGKGGRPRSHRATPSASSAAAFTPTPSGVTGAASVSKSGEIVVSDQRCELTGLLSGMQYRITVTPRNHLGEVCTSSNAVVTARTEGAVHWKM